ncbi:hypothetical protein SAMN05421504_101187 [Amycolatopsis xylanica]|uniref:Uncharacterized protein n=1 Tax=Amycolatopsis xylanica TaxID=589385 RepID=A0A1H2SDI3_9PSEU|nr:hypothetical protein [Amycolatopsis xylanica]SDW29558.1 hypothetical protein SAMN05421504_101187 [Amycolatopsis xylanica]
MTEHELGTLMRELADEPAPPMALDLDKARRTGDRRRRLRTTALAAGCAAVVAAGAITAIELTDTAKPVPPLAAPPQPAPSPPPTDNPLVAKASFGWLPDGVGNIEYGVGDHGDYTLALGRGQRAPMIWLAVFDQEPPLDRIRDMGGKAQRVPVQVGAHPGYWVTTNPADPLNAGNTYLRWPIGDGRWAEIHAYYLDFPEVRQALLRVAGSVTFATRGVPLPLRIAGLPPGFQLSDGQLWRRPDSDGVPWKLQLSYTVNGANVLIEVAPPGGFPVKDGSPVCTTGNGLKVCVTVDREAAAGVDLKALLGRITLLGVDERTWTPHVIR